MKKIIFVLSLFIIVAGIAFWWRLGETPGSLTSFYTDLSSEKCEAVKSGEESSTQKCEGVEGYTLLVEDDDLRMSVTVIDPAGKMHPLNYWDIITRGFSSLGEQAEWRVKTKDGKTIPMALIVRVDANENPDNPNEKTSYFAVTKITLQEICVTDKIKESADALERARQAANASGGRLCLEEIQ